MIVGEIAEMWVRNPVSNPRDKLKKLIIYLTCSSAKLLLFLSSSSSLTIRAILANKFKR